MNNMKRQKDMILKDEPQVGRCPIANEEEQRAISNSYRKNEADGPKQK